MLCTLMSYTVHAELSTNCGHTYQSSGEGYFIELKAKMKVTTGLGTRYQIDKRFHSALYCSDNVCECVRGFCLFVSERSLVAGSHHCSVGDSSLAR